MYQAQIPQPPPAKLLGNPEPQKSHLLRNLLLAASALSIVLLLGWNTINHNHLHWPIDFGVQTAILLFILAFLIHSVIKFFQHLREIKPKQEGLNPLYPFYTAVTLAAFLGVGYLEFRHQFVQITTTPIIRKISGVDTALARCDRAMANLFAPTRKGYVQYEYADGQYTSSDIAHFHPAACADIFNWYVWQGKTNTTDYQIHTLDMISHEAVHIGGVRSELIAKCASTEWTEDVLLFLGAKPDEAKRVAEINRKNANDYQGRGPGSQTSAYEGNCDSLPSFRKD